MAAAAVTLLGWQPGTQRTARRQRVQPCCGTVTRVLLTCGAAVEWWATSSGRYADAACTIYAGWRRAKAKRQPRRTCVRRVAKLRRVSCARQHERTVQTLPPNARHARRALTASTIPCTCGSERLLAGSPPHSLQAAAARHRFLPLTVCLLCDTALLRHAPHSSRAPCGACAAKLQRQARAAGAAHRRRPRSTPAPCVPPASVLLDQPLRCRAQTRQQQRHRHRHHHFCQHRHYGCCCWHRMSSIM